MLRTLITIAALAATAGPLVGGQIEKPPPNANVTANDPSRDVGASVGDVVYLGVPQSADRYRRVSRVEVTAHGTKVDKPQTTAGMFLGKDHVFFVYRADKAGEHKVTVTSFNKADEVLTKAEYTLKVK
jgi:hypothetical protein